MAEALIRKYRSLYVADEYQKRKYHIAEKAPRKLIVDSEEITTWESTSTQIERPTFLANGIGRKIARKSPNNTGGMIARKSPNNQNNNDIFAGIGPSTSGNSEINTTPDYQETANEFLTNAGSGKHKKRLEIKSSKRSRKSIPKKRNYGLNALNEIKHYQQTTNLLIPKLAFQRLVKEITTNYRPDLRIQSPALGILHHASESYLIETLEMANLCCLHARRVTIMNKDIRLARRIAEKD